MDFALKVLQWSDSEMVRLQLWDIAGKKERRDGNKGRNYLTSKLPGVGSVEKGWQNQYLFFSPEAASLSCSELLR